MKIPVAPLLGGDNVADDLLLRYWAGEASPEERAHLDAWFSQHPDQRAWYEQLYRGLQRGNWSSLTPAVTAERTARILHETGAASGRVQPQERLRGMAWVRYSILGIVTTMFLLAVALPRVPHWVHAKTASLRMSTSTSTFTTANGERATVTLPDGSTIVLSVNSRLDVPADYATGNRTVRLRGEALFTVTSHTGSPFLVIAGPSVTRVLGTRFLVRHYTDDSSALVAVREGKVSVQSSVLTAMQQIRVTSTGTTSIHTATPGQFTFAKGVLTLPEQSLTDAIAELNRWYDADIRLGDSTLGTHQIKGEFATGSLAELTELLELTVDVQVIREGRVLTLYPR